MTTTSELRALRAFAKAFPAVSITRWGDSRLEGMIDRDPRYQDDADRKAWRRFERAHKRLIELGIIEP